MAISDYSGDQPGDPSHRPAVISGALGLILLDAFIWLGFGVIVAAGLHPAIPDQLLVRWGTAILASVAAGFLAALFVALRKRSRIAFFLAMAALLLIALLTAVDEFGWVDGAVLLGHVLPVILLLKGRAWFFSPAGT